ncbi:hypothetical protein ASG43_00145 [Aureimonas sp. Leaf454]|uniref:gluconokinase n=1 Tax=Aureimonas sp. Leaf454 TaxID=1736381 RepID=UPI0006FBDC79|nr:gluconokinase [Aureimonas sp. Leaf454]KQT54087.1 hypothetical protein ASG43_00145 [Aureimonas sp. Leaf454]
MDRKQSRIVVAMGVSGSGKSTLGEALRDRHGFRYVDADTVHPPANVEKMRAGTPLTDDDRAPWLTALASILLEGAVKGEDLVVACSALKTRYREVLSSSAAPVLFAFLAIDRDEVTRRVAARPEHYMPASLVDSQFAALEEPEPGPNVLRLDATRPVEDLCRDVLARLDERASAG